MITAKTKKYHDLALAASVLSDYTRIKIGATIVKDGDIVSVGFNREKTHPIQKKYNVHRGFNDELHSYLHAEMSAIVKAKKQDLNGASIYVSRKTMSGKIGMCKPCAACMKAIQESGIREVYYTTDYGYGYLCFN